ncbi:uncharacterized protein si:ch211-214j8.12 isoform X2 [Brienomyrus brachyistius]|uniref:uncharacterized protein si:ch211-214j8.12 isoform X2 n=1 Tax=Brienomyrus brachyistius TaxID=42636 RepID=UPI0020B23D6D|nr:uncharacterized protein si:ch211-214j8.12 isoform X2 [Brienomyrus brachyistius]
MPLFRRSEDSFVKKGTKKKRKSRQGDRENEGDCSSLIRLCLWSLVENMKDVWTKDYTEKYMDQYSFRYIIGPFDMLPRHLVEELLFLLSSHRLMTRPALHLLLLPQVNSLSLSACSSLVTPNICQLIGIRCQALLSLDLSGTQCDGSVLQSVGTGCRELRHLDVSGCCQLTPISLLSLVHPHAPHTRLPLRSLVASDIGFAKGGDERVAVAVFLLLALPCLLKTALDGLGDALDVIESQDFADLEAFCSHNGMPSLKELWDGRIQTQGKLTEEKEKKIEGLLDDQGMERWLSESEDPDGGDESENGSEHKEADGAKVKVQEKISLHCEHKQVEVKDIGRTEGQTRYAKSVLQDHLTLPLREAHGISCRNMRALRKLCPDLCALSLDCDDSELGHLLVALERWTHELLSLSLHFAGILTEILPAVQTVGATLHHLHLEGVKISDDASFLQLLCLCTKLKTLAIQTESPILNEEEEEEEDEEQGIQGLPCLSQLRFLSVKFFIDHSKKKPLMCWRSLKWLLLGLLRGSPLLEKVTLVAIPCSINSVFQMLLETHHLPPAADRVPPLCQLRYLSLAYCDVSMETVTRLVTLDGCLSTLDLSGCWTVSADNIEQLQGNTSRRKHSLKIVWT